MIVWENLDVMRHVLRDASGKELVVHTRPPPPSAFNANNAAGGDAKAAGATGTISSNLAAVQESDRKKFMDASTGLEMEKAQEPMPLLEWLAENYQSFGTSLEFVTDRSQEGNQFVKGFGGIGGMLRYKVDFNVIADAMEEGDDEFFDSDEDYM